MRPEGFQVLGPQPLESDIESKEMSMLVHSSNCGFRLHLSLLFLALSAPATFGVDGLDDAGGYGSVAFDMNAAATDVSRTCAAQADGKILMAGSVTTSDSEQVQIAIARVKTDSLLDPTFDNDGKLVIDLSQIGIQATHGRAYAMTVDSQGRILIAGSMVLISNG